MHSLSNALYTNVLKTFNDKNMKHKSFQRNIKLNLSNKGNLCLAYMRDCLPREGQMVRFVRWSWHIIMKTQPLNECDSKVHLIAWWNINGTNTCGRNKKNILNTNTWATQRNIAFITFHNQICWQFTKVLLYFNQYKSA